MIPNTNEIHRMCTATPCTFIRLFRLSSHFFDCPFSISIEVGGAFGMNIITADTKNSNEKAHPNQKNTLVFSVWSSEVSLIESIEAIIWVWSFWGTASLLHDDTAISRMTSIKKHTCFIKLIFYLLIFYLYLYWQI